jgi:hypothetical protein
VQRNKSFCECPQGGEHPGIENCKLKIFNHQFSIRSAAITSASQLFCVRNAINRILSRSLLSNAGCAAGGPFGRLAM